MLSFPILPFRGCPLRPAVVWANMSETDHSQMSEGERVVANNTVPLPSLFFIWSLSHLHSTRIHIHLHHLPTYALLLLVYPLLLYLPHHRHSFPSTTLLPCIFIAHSFHCLACPHSIITITTNERRGIHSSYKTQPTPLKQLEWLFSRGSWVSCCEADPPGRTSPRPTTWSCNITLANQSTHSASSLAVSLTTEASPCHPLSPRLIPNHFLPIPFSVLSEFTHIFCHMLLLFWTQSTTLSP